MKYIALSMLFTCVIFCSCGLGSDHKEQSQTITTDSTKTVITKSTPLPADSTTTDSVIKDINIEGVLYTISVVSDKYDADHQLITADNEAPGPLTFVITKQDDGKIVLKEKFTQNEFNLVKKGKVKLSENGKLYLSLIDIGGGSGFAAMLFNIAGDGHGKLHFIKIMEYGELTYFVFNKADNEVLRIAGIWDSEESHFSDHRYRIYRYIAANSQYTEKKIGETKYKYPGADDDKPFKEIMEDVVKKEPTVLQDIKLSDYMFDDN